MKDKKDTKDINRILEQIQPCDTRKPYIFVSYSNADWEMVATDVLEFQRRGYNIWMDKKNLDSRKDAWTDDALPAINSWLCQMVLFYISSSSLCSQACLEELQECGSEKAKANHNRKVEFVAVEVEPIGHIKHYCDRIYEKIRQDALQELERDGDDEKAQSMFSTLAKFRKEFFPDDNKRVRLLSRNDPDLKEDYYQKIIPYFPPPSSTAELPPKPPEPPTPSDTDLRVVKTLGNTDIKYNICTFGTKFNVGLGVPVTLVLGGKRYERKMHNSGKGRVDSMTQLYTDHGLKLGDVLDARYVALERTIYLTKLDNPQ